jgi:SOS-response transcriptional repressor LexA
MKEANVNKDVNAWSVVYKWLIINNKRQIDLANLLNVSASAISQIKSGNILLNANQIHLLLGYLKINHEDMCTLYTLIFNARLNSTESSGENMHQPKLIVNTAGSSSKKDVSVSPSHHDSLYNVPLISFEQAMNYEPALESIEAFARDCSDQSVSFSNAQAGSFALLVDKENAIPEFAHSAILLVGGEDYPAYGDMVVAKLRTGEVVTKYYQRKDDVIHLKSNNLDVENLVWHYREDPGFVQWMYPIIEANLKLRIDNCNAETE